MARLAAVDGLIHGFALRQKLVSKILTAKLSASERDDYNFIFVYTRELST